MSAPMAAAAIAEPAVKTETSAHPPLRQARPVQPIANGQSPQPERELPAPVAETQPTPEPAVLPMPEEEDPYVVVEVLNVPIEQPPSLA
ncbi:MAG: hypothetical protein ABL994_16260, partial [Verrucomicrobiales bacterium]